jgi:hypothetical protein
MRLHGRLMRTRQLEQPCQGHLPVGHVEDLAGVLLEHEHAAVVEERIPIGVTSPSTTVSIPSPSSTRVGITSSSCAMAVDVARTAALAPARMTLKGLISNLRGPACVRRVWLMDDHPLNWSGNWAMIPSLSMSAMARIWVWTWS